MNAATFTVTNTNDGGAGSLRDAVAQANTNPGADTINFSVTGTITLTTGVLRIESGPLTIAGPGAANLTIDGNLSSRIFAVIDSATTPACPALTGPADYPVTISGLTLQNGSRNVVDSGGGAILSVKTLTLDSMVIRNNYAKGGGGVRFGSQYPGQTLTITNSQFDGNIAKSTIAGNTGAYNGGALNVGDNCSGTRIASVVNIADSVFAGNRVQPDVLEGRGGAIAIYDNATVTMTRIRVYNNGIERPNPPLAFAYPGGGIITTTTSVTITDSEIADNFAQNGGGLIINADVPSLQTPGAAFSFKLINSTVAGNVAFGAGGGVYLWTNVAGEIYNSTVSANLAATNGWSGVHLGRQGGAFLPPTLSLTSSVLGEARENQSDLSVEPTNIPATTINATNTLIQRVCSNCGITVTGTNNLIGSAPLLASLAFNGGPSRTMAMLAGSPVVDSGSNPLGLATDQRGAGFPRTVAAATDMGAQEGPGLCAGFTDVNSVNAFCPNVEWLKNRGITLGCTSTSVYCPSDPVTRLSMAVFMNRLGTALTPQKLFVQQMPGAIVVPGVVGVPSYFCATADVAPAGYKRWALVNAIFSGQADGNAVSWRGFLGFSTDGGATWQGLPTQTGARAYGTPGNWSNAAPVTAIPMEPGLSYRFSVGIRRDNIIAGTTGNFGQSTCQLNAVIANRNGTVSPFDEAPAQDASGM